MQNQIPVAGALPTRAEHERQILRSSLEHAVKQIKGFWELAHPKQKVAGAPEKNRVVRLEGGHLLGGGLGFGQIPTRFECSRQCQPILAIERLTTNRCPQKFLAAFQVQVCKNERVVKAQTVLRSAIAGVERQGPIQRSLRGLLDAPSNVGLVSDSIRDVSASPECKDSHHQLCARGA